MEGQEMITLTIRIHQDIKNTIVSLAQLNDRTMSSQIRVWIKENLK
jgi:predicted transcriptional regulator